MFSRLLSSNFNIFVSFKIWNDLCPHFLFESNRWGKNQVKQGATKSLKEALEDIIPLIRFPVMTMNEFTLDVVPMNLLSQENLVQIFTYFGSSSDKAAQ